jgi:hypothetical protein
MADTNIITIRLSPALLRRADALVPAMRDSDVGVIGRLSRSVVLRLALLRGLQVMEGDASKRPAKQVRKTHRPRPQA